MTEGEAQVIVDAIKSLQSEIRVLRGELTAWRLEMEQRITSLEVKADDLCGNGQPGRMTKVEGHVDRMEVKFGKIAGICISVGSGVGIIAAILGWAFPRH